jgi:hypothetical protein
MERTWYRDLSTWLWVRVRGHVAIDYLSVSRSQEVNVGLRAVNEGIVAMATIRTGSSDACSNRLTNTCYPLPLCTLTASSAYVPL